MLLKFKQPLKCANYTALVISVCANEQKFKFSFHLGTSINDVPRFLAIFDLPIYLPTLSYSITSYFRDYLGPPTYPNIGRHKWTFSYVHLSHVNKHLLNLKEDGLCFTKVFSKKYLMFHRVYIQYQFYVLTTYNSPP